MRACRAQLVTLISRATVIHISYCAYLCLCLSDTNNIFHCSHLPLLAFTFSLTSSLDLCYCVVER